MHNSFCSKFLRTLSIVGLVIVLSELQGCSGSQEQKEEPLKMLPMEQIALNNLDAFQPVAENWSIAGGVESDRNTEHDLKPLEGTGVLVNIPIDDEVEDHLFTKWTHGDLDLELDVLMPRGSNSGIYLMGRYEVQLLDSWGVEEPKFGDIGGIYERWDDDRPEGEEGYEGHAPRINAARAPGLWQHLEINFKAPEFNEKGEKISNAEFTRVWLNGVLVQKNVEVTGPTRSAAFQDEQARGPLMIQGDHGPVAFRNIRYKRYDKKKIELTDLQYDYYDKGFEEWPDFDTLTPDATGKVDSIKGNPENVEDRQALVFRGNIHLPNSGTYFFRVDNAGKVRITIDGKPVMEQNRFYRFHETESVTTELDSGDHDFTFYYIDHPVEWYQGLTFYMEGPHLRFQKMHALSSLPRGAGKPPELVVEANDHVKALRSFGMHKGLKHTHVINTGSPEGINYNYDIGQAAMLHIWNGPYLDTGEMWIGRGEPQMAKPLGPAITLAGKPTFAFLDDSDAAWPDSLSWDHLDVEGYTMTDGGWPAFKYALDGVQIEDRLAGQTDPRRLVRTIHFEGSLKDREDLWMRLASGKTILETGEGEYVIDDRTYYLDMLDAADEQPTIRDTEDGQQLILPAPTGSADASVEYSIIW